MTRLARSVLAGLALSVLIAGGHATTAWARAGAYLADLVKTEPYRSAWTKMLAKEHDVPSWVKDFSVTGAGDTTSAHMVPVGYRAYLLATLCKGHDCANSILYVMFAPDGAQAYAKLVEGGKTRWLGRPDAATQAALTAAQTQ
jgi:hypothetical protein